MAEPTSPGRRASSGPHGSSAVPGPPAGPLVHARGLTKRFGTFTAVDAVDFDIAAGEAFGFLGPNGAGKTSTMRMVSCMSPVTAGTLAVFGLDPAIQGATIRGRIGLVPQEDTLDPQLTALDNLVVYGRYFDIPRKEVRRRAGQLLEFIQLAERAHDRVEPLSGGMKRRLTIARALISEPDLLILDEPTTGLDPQARHLVWDRLYRLKQQGVTLAVTTHYMDEAEQLCDRLVIMDGGRIAAEGPPHQLIDRYSTREVVELRYALADYGSVSADLTPHLDGLVTRHEVLPDRLLLYADDGEAVVEQVHRSGSTPERTLVRRSNLEDVFLYLTGRSLVD